MRSRTMLRLTTIAASATVLAATALPAGALDRPVRADARGAGLEITLPGGTSFAGGLATSNVSASRATATGTGLTGVEAATSTAESSGATVRDPAEGQNCATPAVPAELSGLVAGLACSSAEANGSSSPSASATADLGRVDLDGSLIADVLLRTIAGPVVDQVNAVTGEVSAQVLEPVIAEVASQCNAVVDQLPVDTSQLPTLPGLPAPLPDLTPVLDELADLTGDPCVILTRLVTQPPVISDIDAQRLIEELASAFDGVDLLSVSLGGSTSSVTTSSSSIETVGTGEVVQVSSASLAFLLPTVEALVDELVEPFLAELEAVLAPLGADAPVVATVQQVVATVLDTLDIPLLTSDEPLLTIGGVTSTATAVLDLATGAVTTSGAPATVSITVSTALAELLGQERTVSVAPGQTQTLFEGTPLESTISVGDANEFTDEVDGIAGTGIRVSGVDITLLKGLEGGLAVSAGSALAVAGAGNAPATPVGTPNLPTTGGGLALAGVLALAGAYGLRRLQTA